MSAIDVVKASRTAFQEQDAVAAAALLADDFTFTSPQDDHIDKAAYMEICFPTAGRFGRSELLEIVETPHGVLSVYEYDLADGSTFRNAELARVVDGRIVEVQVFFGGAV